MRILLLVLLTLTNFSVNAVQVDIEKQYLGKYAPKGKSCSGDLNITLNQKNIIISSGSNKISFGNIDHCFSCQGGARYSGKVIWLIPEFGQYRPSRLTFYINHNEVDGDLGVEIKSADLIEKLGFTSQIFIKCS